jgi:hypothetical protein
MEMNLSRLLPTVLALLLIASPALAGPLPTDTNAIAGWQGSTLFSDSNGGFNLVVDIEYAVYAPGQFGSSAALGLPADPSGGADFVYAYQALNNVNLSTTNLINLSVGLTPGTIPNGSTNIGFVPGFGLNPNVDQFIPAGDPKTSARWTWAVPLLNPGINSTVVYFTSPYGPGLLLSSITGGHATLDSTALPSPVPEPSTLLLAAIAAACLFGVKLSRNS